MGSETGLVPANYIRVIEDVPVFDAEDDIQSSVCFQESMEYIDIVQ